MRLRTNGRVIVRVTVPTAMVRVLASVQAACIQRSRHARKNVSGRPGIVQSFIGVSGELATHFWLKSNGCKPSLTLPSLSPSATDHVALLGGSLRSFETKTLYLKDGRDASTLRGNDKLALPSRLATDYFVWCVLASGIEALTDTVTVDVAVQCSKMYAQARHVHRTSGPFRDFIYVRSLDSESFPAGGEFETRFCETESPSQQQDEDFMSSVRATLHLFGNSNQKYDLALLDLLSSTPGLLKHAEALHSKLVERT